MSKFIKLSKLIINTNAITHINIKSESILINLQFPRTNGFYLFAFGSINSDTETICVQKNTDPLDYHIMQEWIKKLN